MRNGNIVKGALLFTLLGIDSDKGGEFSNGQLGRYGKAAKVTFTRGRSGRKDKVGSHDIMRLTMTDQPSIDTLIFDVGGVLVQLTGIQQMIDWCGGRLGEAELWQRWLTSPAVRAFEAGRCDAATFGVEVVREFDLSVGPEEYLAAFERWPSKLFPGAAQLLRTLTPRPQLVSLSNTNALHWGYVCDNLGLGPLFDRHFPSHETGLMKPDREVFEHVARSLGGPPERMVFLDDNLLNVDAARAAGMLAYRVVGLEQTAQQLRTLGFSMSQ